MSTMQRSGTEIEPSEGMIASQAIVAAPRLGLADYLQGITFRLIQPNEVVPPDYNDFQRYVAQHFHTTVDIINTRLPENEAQTVALLQPLCRVPRMSTFALGAMINRIVAEMPDDHVFLNVGTWHGYTFFSGLLGNPGKRCIGVDNYCESYPGPDPRSCFQERFIELKSHLHFFYEMDYQEYFANVHRQPIGFYLFDGPHTYEHQLRGLQIAEPFFAEGCVVMVDDINLEPALRATIQFMEQSRYRYEVLLHQHTTCNAHPTFWNGILIFRRVA